MSEPLSTSSSSKRSGHQRGPSLRDAGKFLVCDDVDDDMARHVITWILEENLREPIRRAP